MNNHLYRTPQYTKRIRKRKRKKEDTLTYDTHNSLNGLENIIACNSINGLNCTVHMYMYIYIKHQVPLLLPGNWKEEGNTTWLSWLAAVTGQITL